MTTSAVPGARDRILSLMLMLHRAHPDRTDQVSATWNIAYDGGVGLGAAGFGLWFPRHIAASR